MIRYHEITKSPFSSLTFDDTAQLYYAHGDYMRMHLLKPPHADQLVDYYLTSGPLYVIRYRPDSLFNVNLTRNDQTLISFKVKKIDEKILQRDCEEIDMATSEKVKDSVIYTDTKIVFSRNFLPVDPDHFKNCYSDYFNKIMAETGAWYLNFSRISYGSSHKNVLSRHSYEIIDAHEYKVDTPIFYIDRSKITNK